LQVANALSKVGERLNREGGDKVIDIGEQAPDFQLTDDAGQTVGLSDFRGKKVILYFYPKALSKG
jgi:peroxiredoxin